MAHRYSAIVRIVPIQGTFPDAKSARTHLHVQHGRVLLVVPSGETICPSPADTRVEWFRSRYKGARVLLEGLNRRSHI